mmetsp:Transcript_13280/g.32465  ORF Transcript_13280/g.32465 Transcript_13280/m.32465 type:complete len:155 (+) Transcript_13280:242-706(+)|eukprot:CAMPEP_0178991534 /NCGR_PEP_ID=MMETSP0795-20121207/5584_1 /TAXON_ID=88552 /ORGANISM="Amoebophrya sp., Strain Ameob2" /LENGTH=154 /DNA_ID=CAMNT_0020683259 /DNA_START=429 /DNA_END=893 /DNA_ORIENTATION=-
MYRFSRALTSAGVRRQAAQHPTAAPGASIARRGSSSSTAQRLMLDHAPSTSSSAAGAQASIPVPATPAATVQTTVVQRPPIKGDAEEHEQPGKGNQGTTGRTGEPVWDPLFGFMRKYHANEKECHLHRQGGTSPTPSAATWDPLFGFTRGGEMK